MFAKCNNTNYPAGIGMESSRVPEKLSWRQAAGPISKTYRKVREMATWHEEPVKEKCLEEIVCSILWTHLRYI
jgi:hypothetical protein